MPNSMRKDLRKLCAVADVDPRKGRIISLDDHDDILLVRQNDNVYAYSNRCPHANAHLNMNGERIIALDEYHILCTVHGAQFNPVNGKCVLGPCKGQHLSALDITIIDDEICLLT